MRAREAGLFTSTMPAGSTNTITDVAGVLVGQVTLHNEQVEPPVHTGVTVILPHPGDLFQEMLPAAVHTINGYGKAAGFEQVREMGTLEAPIAMTNTLCVGRALDGLVTWMLDHHPEIGAEGPSVNPVVMECNDSRLNDLRGRHVSASHVLQALEKASSGPVEEGSVGAGAGMMCYGYKGGVGTASRRIDDKHIGVLLVANFGRKDQLIIRRKPVGQMLTAPPHTSMPDQGSVVICIATDIPLTDRQLGRIARRAVAGLARTGSTIGSGSGDFVLAFSTAQRIFRRAAGSSSTQQYLNEDHLDRLFDAVVEAVEESVLNALCQAAPVRGPGGYTAPALPIEQIKQLLEA